MFEDGRGRKIEKKTDANFSSWESTVGEVSKQERIQILYKADEIIWSVDRMRAGEVYAFEVKCGEQHFEARTDGFLKDEKSEELRTIIEVKSHLRNMNGSKARMQESAQMVGWIVNKASKPSTESNGR